MKTIVIIVLSIVFSRLYHKVFDVVYFSFSALCKEWAVCVVLAMFVASFIFGG